MEREELNRKAASWWKEALKNPEQDNGYYFTSQMISILAKRHDPIPENKLDIFEKEVVALLNEFDELYGAILLQVNYEPCQFLSEAARRAGISCSLGTFPCKTNMEINYAQRQIAVSRGFQGPWKVLIK